MKKQQQYFRNIDSEYAYPLKHHLDEARADGLDEVTLFEAVPDFHNPDYIFCSEVGEVGERLECRKHLCESYEPRGNAKGGPCAHRGWLYEHGDEKTFKVEQPC